MAAVETENIRIIKIIKSKCGRAGEEEAFQKATKENVFLALIESGEIPKEQRENFRTCYLVLAAIRGFNDAIIALREKGMQFNGDEIGRAAKQKQWKTVDLLLELKAPMNDSTIANVIKGGSFEYIKKVVKHGAPLKNCLQWVYETQDVELADYFIKRKKYIPNPSEMEVLLGTKNRYLIGQALEVVNELSGNRLENFFKCPVEFRSIVMSKIQKFTHSSLWDFLKLRDKTAVKYCKIAVQKGAKPSQEVLSHALLKGKIQTFEYLYGVYPDALPLHQQPSLTSILKFKRYNTVKILINKYDFHITSQCIQERLPKDLKNVIVSKIWEEIEPDLSAKEKEILTLEKFHSLLFEIQKAGIFDHISTFDYVPPLKNLLKLAIQDSQYYSIPLKDMVINHIENSKQKWSFVFPGFNLPEDLEKLSTLYFNLEVYKQILSITTEACVKEKNSGAELHAYKLSVFFGCVEKALKYLALYRETHKNSTQPVHDACLFELPKKGYWNIDFWRKMMEKYHFSAKKMNILSLAADLESLLKGPFVPFENNDIKEITQFYKNNLIEQLKHHTDKNYAKLITKARALQKADRKEGEKLLQKAIWGGCALIVPFHYKSFLKGKDEKQITENIHTHFHAFLQFIHNNRNIEQFSFNKLIEIAVQNLYTDVPQKYMSFAIDCAKEGIQKKAFEKALTILNEKSKLTELLPTITIDGEELGFPQLEFRKIASNEPQIFILGKKTGCCQNIDGHSKDCVVHGAESPFGGFYAITNKVLKDNIVAQSWTGITDDNSVVFDSIEFNKGQNEKMIMQFYQKAADAILKARPEIKKVLFGGGGNTPIDHPFVAELPPFSRIVGYKDVGYDSKQVRFCLSKQSQQPEIKPISKNDLVLMNGIDSYVYVGKKFKSLSLDPLKRQLFFNSHLDANLFLMSEKKNPLLEEGHFEEYRERIGELFLTFKATQRLVEKKFPNFNVLTFENNRDGLKDTLSNLSLKPNETFSIFYVDGVHAISAYFENIEGENYCFLFDPESHFSDDIINVIDGSMGVKKFIRMTAKLQVDYSNCSTFTYKSLFYFAKHGKELFKQVDVENKLQFVRGKLYNLKEEFTPPQLLKMSQTVHKMNLSEEALKTIVSAKKNLTLAGYLKEYEVTLNDKLFNSAAQVKKYKYISQLDGLLK
jgi:hypothetical protein